MKKSKAKYKVKNNLEKGIKVVKWCEHTES